MQVLLLQLQARRVLLMLVPRGGCRMPFAPCRAQQQPALAAPSLPWGWGGCETLLPAQPLTQHRAAPCRYGQGSLLGLVAAVPRRGAVHGSVRGDASGLSGLKHLQAAPPCRYTSVCSAGTRSSRRVGLGMPSCP